MNDKDSHPLASVEFGRNDGVDRARLVGEIDLSNARQLADRIAQGTSEALHVVLDCTEVSFMDSSGLRLIHELAADCLARTVELTIIAPADSVVARLLRLAPPASGSVVERSPVD